MSVPSNFHLLAFYYNGDQGISAINKRGHDAGVSADMIGPSGAINENAIVQVLNNGYNYYVSGGQEVYCEPATGIPFRSGSFLYKDFYKPAQYAADSIQMVDLVGVLAYIDPSKAKQFGAYNNIVDAEAYSGLLIATPGDAPPTINPNS